MFNSLLDTDLYKFSTSYAYMRKYPEAEGTFVFNDRNNTEYTEEEFSAICTHLKDMESWSITPELFNEVVTAIPYIPLYYWEWLNNFRFDFSKISISRDNEGHLSIEVTDKLYKVTLYEIPILYIVSEVIAKSRGVFDSFKEQSKLNKKIRLAINYHLVFSEFGTRRRGNSDWQMEIVKQLSKSCSEFVGTSNVYIALKLGITPVGTFPHEWVMFHGAVFGYKMANYLSLEDWSDVYQGQLGTALIDTYTTNVFLRNFSRKQAKLFDGVRQDSGDEYKIGNAVIDRYYELGIDPTTKVIIFSNALTFEKYRDISNYFKGRIRVSAGIGTNLTNDWMPSNIVMKLMEVRMSPREDWSKCIKLSDDEGKHMGDEREVESAKYQLGL